jgi:uncharacterized protein (TIGR03437 family)
MGLRNTFWISTVFLLSINLYAAPKLRLSNTVVGPVQVAQGGTASNVPAIEAANVGDGTLSLQVTPSPSAPWLTANVGAAHACSLAAQCFPITFTLATAALGPGSYSGTVIVNDPAAIDAPQTILVTVQVGSNVPDRLDFYVAPNGTNADAKIFTATKVTNTITTQGNLPFLTMALSAAGSFTFNVPYNIIVKPADLAEGTYTATLTTAGSTLAADNKAIPISVNVTTKPIAKAVAADPGNGNCSLDVPANTQGLTGTLRCRALAGSKVSYTINMVNAGQGALTVSAATTAVTSGPADWLSVLPSGNTVVLTLNATSLAAGSYQGTLTVATNAVNTTTIPVQLDVSTAAGPTVFFGQVLNNATFLPGEPIAQGDITIVKGEQLATGDLVVAPTVPYPPTLNNVQVLVNGKPAPLYYTLPFQLAFQVPYDTPVGPATVQVVQNGKPGNLSSMNVVASAPRILRRTGDYGAIINADQAGGSLPYPSTPADPVFPTHPAKMGDTLLIYAIGLGQTTSVAAVTGAGAPTDPLAALCGTTTPCDSAGYRILFGGGFNGSMTAIPSFVGLAPTFAGLYQINVTIPPGTPTGNAVPVTFIGPNGVSNLVTIAIQ